jgi:hypothetical protein
MRVVSLPSATEIVCALGAGQDLVGISHECDHLPEVAAFSALTGSRLPGGGTGDGGDHGRAGLVARRAAAGALPFLDAAYRAGMARYQVSVDRDLDRWRADLAGQDLEHWFRRIPSVVEEARRQPVGFLGYSAFFDHPDDTNAQLLVGAFELLDVSHRRILP